ncbi:hypothetical protein GW17_00041987 [Ensete ventricosum]|nr:hypothetical protein GW17_00041987 [Ensete ventricosum]
MFRPGRYDQSDWRIGLLQRLYSLKENRQVREQGRMSVHRYGSEPREQIQTPVTLTVIIVVVLPITLVPEIASPRPRVRNYSHCLLAAKRPEFSIRGATFTRFICLAGIIRGNGSEE